LNQGGRVVVELAKNSTKIFNKHSWRIIVPTLCHQSPVESILQNHPKCTSDTNMPPKKEHMSASLEPRAVNFTELEDIFICKAWIKNSKKAATSTNQK
jgi:hypothetical protein